MTTSWVRSRACSLLSRWPTWVFAVAGLTTSRAATSAFDNPSATSVALLWTLVLETMFVHGVPHLARWLPGMAAASLAGTADPGLHTVPAWGAAMVLLAYICALAALGIRAV